MRTYDNQGRLVSEINTTFTQDGRVITTNTIYNTNNGQPIAHSKITCFMTIIGSHDIQGISY